MASKYHQSSQVNAQAQLVQWINDAGLSEGTKRANLLRKIMEVMIHQAPQTIPMYIENVLSFVSDKSTDVKKQVVAFIEELSKQYPEYLPKIIGQLQMLVIDSVIAVQKRAIQAASIAYRNVLIWLCKSNAEIQEMQHVWEHLNKLKLLILNMIDSENEGIRTHSIKFLEEVVLLQSSSEDSEDEFTLDKLPAHLPFLKRHALEEEAEHIFQLLLKFHNSQHISSVNLMACMTTLCLLAKLRPKYMPRVVQALGDLHTTLPPTLSQSQVNSVRKHLKMLLLNLIKHPSSNDMLPNLTQLLADIGMTPQEINKIVPKERRNKRVNEIKDDNPVKKLRIDSPQSYSQGSDSNSRSEFTYEDDSSQNSFNISKASVTEDSIFDGLNNIDCVVNLIMSTLLNHLPPTMPSNFITAYKPIPNSGTKTQKKSLAKMILALIKDEPIPTTPTLIPTPTFNPTPTLIPTPTLNPTPTPIQPPLLSETTTKIPLLRDDDEKVTLKNAVAKLQESAKAEREMESAVSKLMEETRQEHIKAEERKTKEKEKLVAPPTPSIPKLKQKVKLLKLQELTRPIPKDIKEKLMLQAVERILRAEQDCIIGGAEQIRTKFITIFASSYTSDIRELVLHYILEDPVNRIDLALSWLYEEYSIMQGFNRHPLTLKNINEKHDQNYNQLLCSLITQICERGDPLMENSKDILMRKIYLESPVITEEAIDYLKHLVSEEKMALLALDLLEELCLMRPPRAHKYVASLVPHVLSDNEEIREVALKSSLKVYKNSTDSARRVIEKNALLHLGFITLSTPPEIISPRHARVWTEEQYKLCLSLVIALFPEKEELILEMARVYGSAGAEAKRCVLRALEGPVRAATTPHGPAHPALRPAFRLLLDECPRGAETLLTRLVHILTEKSPPTPELVSKVRELYATRVSDVRFLIPVLTGLSKKEILAALPKLIKLNPAVVREVFNKLLGLQNSMDEEPPVSPQDLLVELHLIDPSKADLKYIIKATAICFAEKNTYTQDVLSAVLQRLAEEREIPVLMMRSVLQALTLHPTLAALATHILSLLIDKEVWRHKVAWEGWVKCCERLQALGSSGVRPLLVALPPPALASLPGPLQQLAMEPQPGNPIEPLPPGME
ncbi:PREDICTED: symplekin isoform X2 [Papilio xuthus]|uniref:Symplekin isoform X2 n=2 Tax=Papilio xuthus TaxID=66420 RepID=A0AAJ6YZF2_PAPXU|nr:PREDICTED: symplekin isoform X2 [Papilio xuthus]